LLLPPLAHIFTNYVGLACLFISDQKAISLFNPCNQQQNITSFLTKKQFSVDCRKIGLAIGRFYRRW
jgi:hypothetical protein